MADEQRLAAVAAKYDVGAVLDCGPNWTFCRATERADGRPVELRIVESDKLASDPRRFLDEVRQVRAVEHPALIPLLDAGASSGIGWVAQATTTGTPLSGRLAPAAAARAGEQLAAALHAVHAQGVLHQDLRCENVVQMAPGSFHLGGFGVGRWMARRPSVLSPELIPDGSATVASDIHALGALLYEVVTGQHPYAPDASADQLEKLAKSSAPRPTALAPDIPAALEEVLLRALSKAPSSRFHTALALQQALAACPGGSGATGAPRGPAHRTSAAFVVAPLLIVAGATWFFLQRHAPPPKEDLAQRARRETAAAPRDASLRIQFGEELERQGRTDDAKRLYDEALAIDPRITGAFVGLARLQDRVGKRDEARRTLRRAIEADPKAWQAVLALARMLKQDSRTMESRVVLEQGLIASPDQPDLKEALR